MVCDTSNGELASITDEISTCRGALIWTEGHASQKLTRSAYRTCKISSTSLIGSSVAIGDNSDIIRSVLSASVSVGASCSVSNSYVFAGASIAENCVISDSIIGENVRIEAGSRVLAGSLVAAGAVLRPGSQLEGSRVSLEQPLEEVENLKGQRESSHRSSIVHALRL